MAKIAIVIFRSLKNAIFPAESGEFVESTILLVEDNRIFWKKQQLCGKCSESVNITIIYDNLLNMMQNSWK